MGSTGKTWKEAASIILFAGTKGSQNLFKPSPATRVFDYRVLLLTRNLRGSFAGAHVFPGGTIDEADFSPSWLELLADAGVSTDLGILTSIKGPRPPMLVEDRNLPVANDIGFRICAIREAFEESGVLLVKKFSKDSSVRSGSPEVSARIKPTQQTVSFGSVVSEEDFPSDFLKIWRKRVHKDASQFISLCRELKCIPDLWALAEWSNWLTPVGQPRRFDTMFYTCCLEKIPEVEHDKSEVIQSQWAHPEYVLQQHCEGKVKFAGPQAYELLRIARYPVLQDLHQFISDRAMLGCVRYLPKIYMLEDGAISVYVGDDLYPSPTNVESLQAVDHRAETIAFSRENCRNLNRMELISSSAPTSTSFRDYRCNVTLPCGHARPRPLEDFKTNPKL